MSSKSIIQYSISIFILNSNILSSDRRKGSIQALRKTVRLRFATAVRIQQHNGNTKLTGLHTLLHTLIHTHCTPHHDAHKFQPVVLQSKNGLTINLYTYTQLYSKNIFKKNATTTTFEFFLSSLFVFSAISRI